MLSKINKEFMELFKKIDIEDKEFYSKEHSEEEEEVYFEKTADLREKMKELAVQVVLEINRVIKEAADDIPDYFRSVEDLDK